MSDTLSDFISTREAADRLGVVTDHINHLLAAGKLHGKQIGRAWLVYIPSLEQYIKTKTPGKGRPPSRKPQPAHD